MSAAGKFSSLALICMLLAAPELAVAKEAVDRPSAAPAPVATGARLAGDQTQTRFVLDLSKHVDIVAFTLAVPFAAERALCMLPVPCS